ncbi:MAG: VWA domain-containing protein [Polyangiales bacterium]
MTFAHPMFLFLLILPAVLIAMMALGDARRRRAVKLLGDGARIESLTTYDAGARRTVKGALRVAAVALAVVALAQPRYGRGTKVVPAADIAAMVVFDVSKSMYAQDVLPSRLVRARNDVARMIKTVPRVRWGAVSFAGEAVALPPTSDAPEVVQFLSAHEPWEMPGGTAIARALELARRQLVPQPSEGMPAPPRRKSVIVLVTDGEDLEGDPIEVAKRCATDGIIIHVVAVGGRAPQPIPNVGEDGVAHGLITDETGALVTTELTPQAEAQLQTIAREGKGQFVRTEEGATGITKVEAALRGMIANEGTERVETLYADVFGLPLGLALLLLIVDSLLGEAPWRKSEKPPVFVEKRRHA